MYITQISTVPLICLFHATPRRSVTKALPGSVEQGRGIEAGAGDAALQRGAQDLRRDVAVDPWRSMWETSMASK